MSAPRTLDAPLEPLTNWAGNIAFSARQLHTPTSVEQLQELVAGSDRVRALGTGHSFNRIADTTGELVSVAGLPRRMEVAADRRTVTVSAGIRYGELARTLHEQGLALHNLGSLPHISVAGACSTGTHGSGAGNGILSTAVRAVELVRADGELLQLSRERDGDRFAGAVVALGALGVLTTLTLAVEPAFEVRQAVYEGLTVRDLQDDFEAIADSGYSVSIFTEWRDDSVKQVWRKRRDGAPAPQSWRGATLADGPRHMVPGMPPVNCTQQLDVPGPWHERLPHFRLDFTPSSGEELQSEYLVPRQHAVAAITALDGLRSRIAPVLQVSEIRTIAADDLWLSPACGRESVGLHFTWVKDTAAVTPVLAQIEEQLGPFAPRPHWGKVFVTAPDTIQGCYPRAADFQRLRGELDPAGRFGNAFLDTYLPALA